MALVSRCPRSGAIALPLFRGTGRPGKLGADARADGCGSAVPVRSRHRISPGHDHLRIDCHGGGIRNVRRAGGRRSKRRLLRSDAGRSRDRSHCYDNRDLAPGSRRIDFSDLLLFRHASDLRQPSLDIHHRLLRHGRQQAARSTAHHRRERRRRSRRPHRLRDDRDRGGREPRDRLGVLSLRRGLDDSHRSLAAAQLGADRPRGGGRDLRGRHSGSGPIRARLESSEAPFLFRRSA